MLKVILSRLSRNVKSYDEMQASSHSVMLSIRPCNLYRLHPGLFLNIFTKSYNNIYTLEPLPPESSDDDGKVSLSEQEHSAKEPNNHDDGLCDDNDDNDDGKVSFDKGKSHDGNEAPLDKGKSHNKLDELNMLIWLDNFSNIICSLHTNELSLNAAVVKMLKLIFPRFEFKVESRIRDGNGQCMTQLDFKGRCETAHGWLAGY